MDSGITKAKRATDKVKGVIISADAPADYVVGKIQSGRYTALKVGTVIVLLVLFGVWLAS